MFYAELIEDCKIVDHVIFLSIAEFAPYREKGWSSTPDTDTIADKLIIENLAGESLEDMGVEENFEEEDGAFHANTQ